MTMLLITAFYVGLSSAGLGALARTVPFPAAWRARKPLGCIVCTAGWCAIIVMLLLTLVNQFAWPGLKLDYLVTMGTMWLAATGLSAYLLSQSGLFVSDPLADFTEKGP